MKAEEKARELIDKMLYSHQGHIDEYTAKQCALICVDEIINSKDLSLYDDLSGCLELLEFTSDSAFIYETKNNYWNKVKQCIILYKIIY